MFFQVDEDGSFVGLQIRNALDAIAVIESINNLGEGRAYRGQVGTWGEGALFIVVCVATLCPRHVRRR